MRGTALLLVSLLLAACDRPAREKKKGAGEPAKRPELATAAIDNAIALQAVANAEPLEKQDRVVIELTGAGEIKHRGKVVSLDGLTAGLMSEQQAYDARMRERGKTGTRLISRGARASKLYVLLRIDSQAPWQHVQWLLTICAETRFDRTQFAVEGGKLDAFLPTDLRVPAIKPGEPDVINEIFCSVHLVARKERPVKWGPAGDQSVLKPTHFLYKFGDRQTADPSNIGRLVNATMKAAEGLEDTSLVGEIKAGHKVPFGRVVDAYARMRAAGLKEVRFSSTAIPTKAQRKASHLPFPKSNYTSPSEQDPAEEEDR